MPRISPPDGMVFHVLNRGVGRQTLFRKPADYSAFEVSVEETLGQNKGDRSFIDENDGPN